MDILRQVELFLTELENRNLQDDQAFIRLRELIKPYNDSVEAHSWEQAHAYLLVVMEQVMTMMNKVMTMMRKVMTEDGTNTKEGQELLELIKHNKIIPIDVLEGYRSALVEISSLANAVSEHAAAIRTNIDLALE